MPRLFLQLDEAYVVDYPGDEAPLLAVGASYGHTDGIVTAINWSKGVYFTSGDDIEPTEHAIPPRYLEVRTTVDPPVLFVLTLADGRLTAEAHSFRLATAEDRAGA